METAVEMLIVGKALGTAQAMVKQDFPISVSFETAITVFRQIDVFLLLPYPQALTQCLKATRPPFISNFGRLDTT